MSHGNVKRVRVKQLFSEERVGHCSSGKISYRNELAAKYALTKLRRHAANNRSEKRIYQCDKCSNYHLTSMNSWVDPESNKSILDGTKNGDMHSSINWKIIMRALDEVDEKFTRDPILSSVVHGAVSEFQMYYFKSTPQTMSIINSILSEIFGDDWESYKNYEHMKI